MEINLLLFYSVCSRAVIEKPIEIILVIKSKRYEGK